MYGYSSMRRTARQLFAVAIVWNAIVLAFQESAKAQAQPGRSNCHLRNLAATK